jgi:hypothetical protein
VRFEIRYPNGEKHEVELQGTVAILGRDPSCDLVINDVKCSRRHAVMEAGPDGLAVRDSGSANGVFVNGRKTDRSPLKEGDEVKLGDVLIRVLPEEVIGTVVMAADEYGGLSTAPPTTELPAIDPDGTIAPGVGMVPPPAPPLPHAAPPPPPPPPIAVAPTAPMAPPAGAGTLPVQPAPDVAPRVAPPLPPPPPPPSLRAPSAGAPLPPMGGAPAPASAPSPKPPTVPASASGRPLTVTILAILWGVSIPLYLLSALGVLFADLGGMRFALAALYLVLTGISGVMGWGLWALKPWARMAQIVIAALGILTCSFAIASIGTIVYLIRPAAKATFSGTREVDPKETVFAIVVGVGVLLGAVAGAGLWGAAAFFGSAASSIPTN